jgi:outer membrane protein insertion porin family
MLKSYNPLFRFAFVGACFFTALQSQQGFPQFLNPSTQLEGQKITKIKIEGTHTVSEDAVLNAMTMKENSVVSKEMISNDIKAIYGLSFFQDVKINISNEGELSVVVVEKPTIDEIVFEGFDEVTPTSLDKKLVTKKYTIFDEKKISQDLRTIEGAYIEKGYYLAKASYLLQESSPGNLKITFTVNQSTPVTVRSVNIVGNQYFSDFELYSFMGTKPFSWYSYFGSSGLYKDEYIAGDQQNLTYYYRDNGFAEATVAAPISILNKDKSDIDVSFYIEQGEIFHIGKVSVTGDLLTTEQDAKNVLTLKEGDLYRISKFNTDMKLLKMYYGNSGYAFAYVYPKFKIDRKNKTYDIIYEVSKGEKAYIGTIFVEGNLKTRDNVIRRSLFITEGELFNASKIELSKDYVNRLGFFDNDVQLLQEPDQANHKVNIRIAVKEKSTGNLQASLGASPNTNGGSGVTFFGSVQYQEKNLLGRAYGLNLNLQLSPSPESSSSMNYTLGVGFTNPSLYDGPWSYSVSGNYQKQVQAVTTAASIEQIYYTQKVVSGSVYVGREIIRNVRFSLGYSISNYQIDPSVPLTAKFFQSGRIEEVSQNLSYDVTNNYMNPTAGLNVNVNNSLAVKGMYGQYQYGMLSSSINYYIPLNFTNDFKTNFRLAFIPKYIYSTVNNGSVPIWKRLQLGGAYQMKGYSDPGETLSPSIPVTVSPVTGEAVELNYGGNRSFYGVTEYFLPLVPEAGLRFVAFGEAGSVLSEGENLSPSKVLYDVGFGFRWVTPVAPFRFEWAFPVTNGRVGKAHFIFTIGYDNVNS